MARKQTPEPSETAPDAALSLAVYEVLVDELKVGGVIAYRTARVNLTKEQAAALNDAQPDSVKFIGI
jgi:hypothetical protein